MIAPVLSVSSDSPDEPEPEPESEDTSFLATVVDVEVLQHVAESASLVQVAPAHDSASLLASFTCVAAAHVAKLAHLALVTALQHVAESASLVQVAPAHDSASLLASFTCVAAAHVAKLAHLALVTALQHVAESASLVQVAPAHDSASLLASFTCVAAAHVAKLAHLALVTALQHVTESASLVQFDPAQKKSVLSGFSVFPVPQSFIVAHLANGWQHIFVFAASWHSKSEQASSPLLESFTCVFGQAYFLHFLLSVQHFAESASFVHWYRIRALYGTLGIVNGLRARLAFRQHAALCWDGSATCRFFHANTRPQSVLVFERP